MTLIANSRCSAATSRRLCGARTRRWAMLRRSRGGDAHSHQVRVLPPRPGVRSLGSIAARGSLTRPLPWPSSFPVPRVQVKAQINPGAAGGPCRHVLLLQHAVLLETPLSRFLDTMLAPLEAARGGWCLPGSPDCRLPPYSQAPLEAAAPADPRGVGIVSALVGRADDTVCPRPATRAHALPRVVSPCCAPNQTPGRWSTQATTFC